MAKKPKEKLEEFAFAVTRSVGSIESIVIHSILFLGAFVSVWSGLVAFESMLLFLTTIVSLEAIYLSIFIQMSVNRQAKAIASVEQNIDEIAEDVEDIQEDIDEIAEDVEDIAEDVEEMQEEQEPK